MHFMREIWKFVQNMCKFAFLRHMFYYFPMPTYEGSSSHYDFRMGCDPPFPTGWFQKYKMVHLTL